MDDSDINNIFKDFEQKVEGKKEASASERKRKLDDEEPIKERYRKAEQALNEEGEMEEKARRERAPSKGTPNYERFGYIAVIVVLVAYIGIDLGFYHVDNKAEEQTVTAAAVKTEESAGEQETETVAEEKQNETVDGVGTEEVAEEKTLSGKITFTLDEVDAEVVNADKDLGQINKVVFTIENGNDKDLTPIVDVYAYDSELDESWETTSRGQYKGAAIEPGDKRTGFINLVPKTFKNLNIKKSIRLTLNDTEEGFITAVNEQVSIS